MIGLQLKPAELYARVDLDARIEGSSEAELTTICFDALKSALAQASLAAGRADHRGAVAALSRGRGVLGGLLRAVDMNAQMGGVLAEFYGSISVRMRDAMRDPQAEQIDALKMDIAEVADVFAPNRGEGIQ